MTRSTVPAQRIIALETIAAILPKAWCGRYDDDAVFKSGHPGEETASDNVVGCLMGMGLPVFLRVALDEPVCFGRLLCFLLPASCFLLLEGGLLPRVLLARTHLSNMPACTSKRAQQLAPGTI